MLLTIAIFSIFAIFAHIVGIWPNFSKLVSVDFFLCFSPKGEYMTIFSPLWRIFSPKKIIFNYHLLWILWRKIREFFSATKLMFYRFPYWQNSAPGVKNHSLTTLDNNLFRKAKLSAMRWRIYDREKCWSQSLTFWHIWEKQGFYFLMRKLRIFTNRMWLPMKLIK